MLIRHEARDSSHADIGARDVDDDDDVGDEHGDASRARTSSSSAAFWFIRLYRRCSYSLPHRRRDREEMPTRRRGGCLQEQGR